MVWSLFTADSRARILWPLLLSPLYASAASLDPQALGFGNVLVGQTELRSATLSNPGSAPLSLGTIAISGPAGHDFSWLSDLSGDCQSNQTLNPGDSCTLRVEFIPASIGTQTRNLVIPILPSSFETLALSGTGVQPVLSISPAGPVDFPATAAGSSSAVEDFTVSNAGSAGSTLELSALQLTGNDTSDFTIDGGSCAVGVELAAGQSCSIGLRFSPASAGPKAAVFEVEATSGSVSLPGVAVALSGLGLTVPQIVTSPETTVSASVAQGDLLQLPLEIANIGQAPLLWSLRDAVGGNPPALQTRTGEDIPRIAFSAPRGAPRGQRMAPAEPRAEADAEVRAAANRHVIGGDLSEDFDDIELLPGRGWDLVNRSAPVGPVGWFQGNSAAAFPAHQGDPDSYIGASYENTIGIGTISNWLLSPEVALVDGTRIRLRTRTVSGSPYPDRLQIRLSLQGASGDVGSAANEVGDFTLLLHEINAGQQLSGYPETWADGSAGDLVLELSGLPAAATGRIGLRYYVENGGPLGSASNYIGIDSFRVEQPGCDGPAAQWSWLDIDPTDGETAGGDSQSVTLTLDSLGLDLGEYVARLCVASNDPQTPLRELDVNFSVVEVPIFRDGFEGP